MGRVIGRGTALCLAVKAAWAIFFGVHRAMRGRVVDVGDTCTVNYVINVNADVPGLFTCRV
jgi:hypothetical protein